MKVEPARIEALKEKNILTNNRSIKMASIKSIKIMASVKEVSPALAKHWLLQNPNSRLCKLSKYKISKYAKEMEIGNWKFNGETIKFAIDGTVLDGQHRLEAIIASGTTQRFVVVQGLTLGAIYFLWRRD